MVWIFCFFGSCLLWPIPHWHQPQQNRRKMILILTSAIGFSVLISELRTRQRRGCWIKVTMHCLLYVWLAAKFWGRSAGRFFCVVELVDDGPASRDHVPTFDFYVLGMEAHKKFMLGVGEGYTLATLSASRNSFVSKRPAFDNSFELLIYLIKRKWLCMWLYCLHIPDNIRFFCR